MLQRKSFIIISNIRLMNFKIIENYPQSQGKRVQNIALRQVSNSFRGHDQYEDDHGVVHYAKA